MTNHDLFSTSVIGTGSAVALVAALVFCAVARAAEPHGCDGFKWPLMHEAGLLQAPGKATLESGAKVEIEPRAFDLKLVAFESAGLPMAPERSPKMTPSRAGFVHFAAPSAAGAYQFTISQAAWIDVIQNGRTIKPSAFSGALDCPGVRKSIRLPLAASPFDVQISGTPASMIAIVAEPVP